MLRREGDECQQGGRGSMVNHWFVRAECDGRWMTVTLVPYTISRILSFPHSASPLHYFLLHHHITETKELSTHNMITRGSIHLRLFVLFSALFSHFAASWSPSPASNKYYPTAPKLESHPFITLMSAGTSDDDGRLILSNMHKIGLVTDESSKLRLLLASQSPRRREILVSIRVIHDEYS